MYLHKISNNQNQDNNNNPNKFIEVRERQAQKQQLEEESVILTEFLNLLLRGLAVTTFIHIAKTELDDKVQHTDQNDGIYDKAVEDRLTTWIEEKANDLYLISNPLVDFFQQYCAVSRHLQYFHRENWPGKDRSNIQYTLSKHEKAILNELTKQNGILSEELVNVSTMSQLATVIQNNKELAEAVRDYCRSVIFRTTDSMIDEFAKLATEKSIPNSETFNKVITKALKLVFTNDVMHESLDDKLEKISNKTMPQIIDLLSKAISAIETKLIVKAPGM